MLPSQCPSQSGKARTKYVIRSSVNELLFGKPHQQLYDYNHNLLHHVSKTGPKIGPAAEASEYPLFRVLQSPQSGIPLTSHRPVPLLTIPASPERPPLCNPTRPSLQRFQHRNLRNRHGRRIRRRRILLLPAHQTRIPRPSLNRRTKNRPLKPQRLCLIPPKSFPRPRPRLHRPQTRIRRRNQPQHEKIPLCFTKRRRCLRPSNRQRSTHQVQRPRNGEAGY